MIAVTIVVVGKYACTDTIFLLTFKCIRCHRWSKISSTCGWKCSWCSGL